MAKREVIEVGCDRCGRIEAQEAGELPEDTTGPEVEMIVRSRGHSLVLAYSDLCRKCRDTVAKLSDRIQYTR